MGHRSRASHASVQLCGGRVQRFVPHSYQQVRVVAVFHITVTSPQSLGFLYVFVFFHSSSPARCIWFIPTICTLVCLHCSAACSLQVPPQGQVLSIGFDQLRRVGVALRVDFDGFWSRWGVSMERLNGDTISAAELCAHLMTIQVG